MNTSFVAGGGGVVRVLDTRVCKCMRVHACVCVEE